MMPPPSFGATATAILVTFVGLIRPSSTWSGRFHVPSQHTAIRFILAPEHLSFAKTMAGAQAVDLAVLIRTQSQLDDHSPAPPDPSLSLPLRRLSSALPRDLNLAPPALRLQADGAPAAAPRFFAPL